MKIITDNYIKLASIECSCCREAHVLEVSLEKDDYSLNFEFKSQNFDLWYKIKNYLKIKFNTESYKTGENRFFNSIIISNSQIRDFVKILKEHKYKSSTQKFKINEEIDRYKNIIKIYFNFEFLILYKIDNNFELCITYEDGSLWKFITGEAYASLSKENVEILLSIMEKNQNG